MFIEDSIQFPTALLSITCYLYYISITDGLTGIFYGKALIPCYNGYVCNTIILTDILSSLLCLY